MNSENLKNTFAKLINNNRYYNEIIKMCPHTILFQHILRYIRIAIAQDAFCSLFLYIKICIQTL